MFDSKTITFIKERRIVLH